MALATLKGGLLVPAPPLGAQGPPSAGGYVMSLPDERLALICQAPAAGNIAKLHWYVNGALVAGDVEGAVQGVAAGVPDGADKNAVRPTVAISAAGWKTWDMSANPAAVTLGEPIAVLVENDETSPAEASFAVFTDAQIFGVAGLPYLWRSATAVAEEHLPWLALEYSTGEYYPLPGVVPASGLASHDWSNGDDPQTRGLKFRLPFPARLRGVWVWGHPEDAAAGGFAVEAFDTTGVRFSTRAKFDLPESLAYSGTSSAVQYYQFESFPNLAKNADYRVCITPQSTNDFNLHTFDVASNAVLDAFDGGKDWYYTSTNVEPPTGLGDWTDTNTSRPFMGLVLDQLDDGTTPATAATLPPRRRILAPTPHIRRRRDTIAVFPPPAAVPILVRARPRVQTRTVVKRRTQPTAFTQTIINQTAIIAYSRKVR